MTTDIPDPDEDPYAFSNGLMPYDRIAEHLNDIETGETRVIGKNPLLAHPYGKPQVAEQPEPAAIHVGQGDDIT